VSTAAAAREEVLVLGGGVIGLTTAVLLAEEGRRVRLWSRDPAEHTVSALAGGLCWPYRVEPAAEAAAWATDSLRVFAALAEDADRTGVRMVTGTMAGGGRLPPEWAAAVAAVPVEGGVRARTPLIDMPVYLRYLRDRLAAAGGLWERRAAASLAEAGRAAPDVVNCTGLAARELAADPAVVPVQGQLVIVADPGVTEWYVDAGAADGTSTYLLPQPYGLVLGGTAREGAESLTPDPAVAEAIVRRCARIDPRVAGAPVLDHRVGLRPARAAVRLETETLPGGARCVHHYGHGGAGVTVSWASAAGVLRRLG
jgi:D-amino-acid oxidase